MKGTDGDSRESGAADGILVFAGYGLDPRKRRLTGPDGVPIHLTSRAFDTLLYLVRHPHEVIDKQRLMQAVWPNSIVEENNLNQQISAVRKALGESAGGSGLHFIVTDPRRGYRFVQDVERIGSTTQAAEESVPSAPPAVAPSRTEDLVSNVSPLFAIRRWSTVWRSAVAAAVGLVVIASGYLLLVGRQSVHVAKGRPSIAVLPFAANEGGTRNLEAYEAYLAARSITNNVGYGQAKAAIGLLERAVELDPNFALAWASLAEAYTFATDFPASMALPLTPVEMQQRISRAALRALELAPDAPESLLSAGMVSMRNRDWAEAERRLRKAVQLAGPDDYDANLLYALFLMNVGRPSEAIPYEERAMRQEPLLLRPVILRAVLFEMRGELDEAEALLLASTDRSGPEALRRQGLIMIRLAQHDRLGAMRLGDAKNNLQPCSSLDDPRRALADLRNNYQKALQKGAGGRLIPIALYAALLGDDALALSVLRAIGPTT